VSGWGP